MLGIAVNRIETAWDLLMPPFTQLFTRCLLSQSALCYYDKSHLLLQHQRLGD